MLAREGRRCKMPCESCAVQFSVFRRKQVCSECERYYCSGCLRREGPAVLCGACRLLSTRPLLRHTISHLKVRDIQCFLQRQNVSTRGCVEKEELVNLCMLHVNGASFRRRGPRARQSPFSSLKGFTNNLNVLITNAFDGRPAAYPAPPPAPHPDCRNTGHAHATQPPPHPPPPQPPQPPPPYAPPCRERFSTTPGGERAIFVPVPQTPSPGDELSDGGEPRVETADCFEIEDLDDSGWEFVTRPADPLPNDSEVLIEENERVSVEPRLLASPPRPVPRASSELTLGSAGSLPDHSPVARSLQPPSPPPPPTPPSPRSPRPPPRSADTLPDSPARNLHQPSTPPLQTSREPLVLEQLESVEDLEALSVRQLKELLARNRVAATGCLERADLLERATRLYRDHAQYRQEIDQLPLEECCKICMAAPLECVLLECGHIAACTACSRQLAECPICRQYVVRAVRCFRS